MIGGTNDTSGALRRMNLTQRTNLMKLFSFAALFTFSFLAMPAAAQDLIFHPDPTLDCLDDATDTAMRHACIGVAANLCILETDSGSSTPVMGGCLDRERAWWDARLNDVYGQLLQQYDKQPEVAERMRDMQRIWITYRDARCDYEGAQWGRGTGVGPALIACAMTATAEQTLFLESNLR